MNGWYPDTAGRCGVFVGRHWQSKTPCFTLHRLPFRTFSLLYTEKIPTVMMHTFVTWNEIIVKRNETVFICHYSAFQNIRGTLLLASARPQIHSRKVTAWWKAAFSHCFPPHFTGLSYCIRNNSLSAHKYFLFHWRKKFINNDPAGMWIRKNISRTINSPTSDIRQEKMPGWRRQCAPHQRRTGRGVFYGTGVENTLEGTSKSGKTGARGCNHLRFFHNKASTQVLPLFWPTSPFLFPPAALVHFFVGLLLYSVAQRWGQTGNF